MDAERTVATRGLPQDYVLTKKGRELFPVIVALRQWEENHLFLAERSVCRLWTNAPENRRADSASKM